jgi:hypothetical protein
MGQLISRREETEERPLIQGWKKWYIRMNLNDDELNRDICAIVDMAAGLSMGAPATAMDRNRGLFELWGSKRARTVFFRRSRLLAKRMKVHKVVIMGQCRRCKEDHSAIQWKGRAVRCAKCGSYC